MFIRKTTETIDILNWVIPKDRFVIVWSTPGLLLLHVYYPIVLR